MPRLVTAQEMCCMPGGPARSCSSVARKTHTRAASGLRRFAAASRVFELPPAPPLRGGYVPPPGPSQQAPP
eukprot:8010952-Alexandrium_andersonii.AAC.1